MRVMAVCIRAGIYVCVRSARERARGDNALLPRIDSAGVERAAAAVESPNEKSSLVRLILLILFARSTLTYFFIISHVPFFWSGSCSHFFFLVLSLSFCVNVSEQMGCISGYVCICT